MQHAYIPTTILTDQGSVFVSKLMQELAKLLEIELKHATVKHAQTIGLLERTHSSLKRVLKIENLKARRWSDYVDTACFIYNTTYHASLGCSPALLFHGTQPYNPIDLRFRTNWKKDMAFTTDTVTAIQDRMSELLRRTKENVVLAYLKYRQYYDEKAKAQPLKRKSYCLLLNPKMVTQSDALHKGSAKWIPLYQVEKVLTYSNYIVRKVGTHHTQCVHRIRLRPIEPQYEIEDVDEVKESLFVKDPTIPNEKSEPQAFDDYLRHVIGMDAGDTLVLPTAAENQTDSLPTPLPSTRSLSLPAPPVTTAAPSPEPQPAAPPAAPVTSTRGGEGRYNLRRAINPPLQLHETVSEIKPQKRVTFKEPKIIYRHGDIFMAKGPIGHCVSADAAMSAGIAQQMNRAFLGLRRHVKTRRPKVGSVVPFHADDPMTDLVYNLVTKRKFFHKPTVAMIAKSINAMRDHAVKHKVKLINLPLIACGLDRQDWKTISKLLLNAFGETRIKLRIWVLDNEIAAITPRTGRPMMENLQMKAEATFPPPSIKIRLQCTTHPTPQPPPAEAPVEDADPEWGDDSSSTTSRLEGPETDPSGQSPDPGEQPESDHP